MAPTQDLRAAFLGASGVEPTHDLPAGRRPDNRCARHQVDNSITIGAVSSKGLAPSIEMVPPSIAHSPNIDIEPELFRTELPDTPAVEAPHPMSERNAILNGERYP